MSDTACEPWIAPEHQLTSGRGQYIDKLYDVISLRLGRGEGRGVDPALQPHDVSDEAATPVEARPQGSLAQRVLALEVVAFPILCVLTGAAALGSDVVSRRGVFAACTVEAYQALVGAVPNTCVQHHPVEVPIYQDLLSVVGTLAALGIWFLYVRLSRLLAHVPASTAAGARILPGGHENALSNTRKGLERFRLLADRWDQPDGFVGPSNRSRLISQLAMTGVAIAVYLLYTGNGSVFRRICSPPTGASASETSTCIDRAREGWWADWHSAPWFAVMWILILSLALSFGLDNFRTTGAFMAHTRRALSLREVAQGAGRLERLPLILNYPGLPTTWTFLQGVLTEIRLGFLPTISSLLVVLAMGTGPLWTISGPVVDAVLFGLLLVIVVCIVLRLRTFERFISQAARRTLILEIDDGTPETGPGARRPAKAEEIRWIMDHGVLPPIAFDGRAKVLLGYFFGFLGLVFALLQTLHV